MILNEMEWLPLFDDYFTKPGKTIVIVGAKRSGKTALAFRLGELAQKVFKRDVYLFETRKLENIPFKTVKNLNSIPLGSFVIIDEASIKFSSRRAFSKPNVLLSNLLAISGHKDLTIIFVSQVASMLDINILRLGDTLFVKEPGFFQAPLDRNILYDVLVTAKAYFSMVDTELRKKLFVAFSDKYYSYLLKRYSSYMRIYGLSQLSWLLRNYAILRCTNELPTFWSEKVSKRFRAYGLEDDLKLKLNPTLYKIWKACNTPIKLKYIAKRCNLPYNTVKNYISKLVTAGLLVKVKQGVYVQNPDFSTIDNIEVMTQA